MPALATAATFVPAILQGAQALKQNRLAKNLKQSDYIPSGVLESEARSRRQANATEAPGEAAAKARLERQTSNTTSAVRSAAKDSSTVLDKVQEADAVAKAKEQDIEAQAQEFRYRNDQNLQKTLQTKAQYQQRNRDQYNAAKSALKGAAAQNAFNAFNNATSAAVMLGQNETPMAPSSGSPSNQARDAGNAIINPPEIESPEQQMMDTVNRKYPKKIKTPNYREPAPTIKPFGFMDIN